MRVKLSFWTLALAASGCLQASPLACVPGSFLSYESLGVTGCTIGPVTVKSFSFNVNSTSGGATAVTDSQITVTPQTSLQKIGVRISSSGFSVTAGQSVEYLISYTWDPSDDISSTDDVLDDPVMAPAALDITTNACAGLAFSGATCSATPKTLNVFDHGTSSQLFSSAPFAPVGVVGIRNTIDLNAVEGGSASFSALTNEITLPEPGTWLSAAVSLILLVGKKRLRAYPRRSASSPQTW
jgi:hypothetical protein